MHPDLDSLELPHVDLSEVDPAIGLIALTRAHMKLITGEQKYICHGLETLLYPDWQEAVSPLVDKSVRLMTNKIAEALDPHPTLGCYLVHELGCSWRQERTYNQAEPAEDPEFRRTRLRWIEQMEQQLWARL